jgi:hypothetical protein
LKSVAKVNPLTLRSISPSVELEVAAFDAAAQPLSAAQALFQAQRAKIEACQLAQTQQQARLQDFERRYFAAIQPFEQLQTKLQLQMAQYLDRRLDGKGLAKNIRTGIAELICAIAMQLQSDDRSETALIAQALLEKHQIVPEAGASGSLSDEIMAEINAMFGFDDTGQNSAQQREADKQARQTARKDAAANKAKQADKLAAKKTTPTPTPTATATDANQSLRSVYRKLVSLLHPDREPDAAVRLHKTALMVQVNRAHENKDLLALLTIQWQVLETAPEAILQLEEEKLHHFNQLLAEQLQKLTAQLHEAESVFRHRFGVPHHQPLQEKILSRLLRERVADCKDHLLMVQEGFALIQDDVGLKYWVKSQSQRYGY